MPRITARMPIDRIDGGGEGQQPEQVEDVQRIGRRQILDPQDERLVPHFDRQHQHLVEGIEDRDLDHDRKAAGERIRSSRPCRAQRNHQCTSFSYVLLIPKLYLARHIGLKTRAWAIFLYRRNRENGQELETMEPFGFTADLGNGPGDCASGIIKIRSRR